MPIPALLVLALAAPPAGDPVGVTHGPFVGHVSPTEAHVWVRLSAPAECVLTLRRTDGEGAPARATGRASPSRDLTVVLVAGGLAPATAYAYEIAVGGRRVAGGPGHELRTAPPPDAPARVRIALGSCADDRRYARQPVWSRIAKTGAEAVVLLGDTPYIDTTDLAVQRRRYREFYAVPGLGALLRSTPFYATWDDHDFGRNDSDGRVPGKRDARRAFTEYHANPSYGLGGEGVFTSFRRGPLEVFLLDTRWFAGTEVSPHQDGRRATLLGAAQWAWLEEALVASTAPFKVIACGMVWNGSLRLGKNDHWMTYPYERDALFRLVGEHGIGGVVLFGGDIHRSRVLRHETSDLAGYDLTEVIASPLANRTMWVANVPHPGLLEDAAEPHSFVLLTADTTADEPSLTAACMAADGRVLFEVALPLATLRAR